MGLWTKVDSNPDHELWEAPLPSGNGVIRMLSLGLPADWWLEHHTKRFGDKPPLTELGERGCRLLFPDETEWREYSYVPRKS